ncbi:ribosomal-protein-alanine N-acetyltransferase [Pirellula sp. SH-Sr6A]|nr:ribosomal-protein-alanine N-acetyltransferase [Pirellula sp. SH-Sr6A]
MDIPQHEVRWRRMLLSDFELVSRIEHRAFLSPTHPYFQPYSRQQFEKLLRERFVFGFVLYLGECVLAYSICKFSQEDTFIYRIAVDPDHQRTGVGDLLVQLIKASVKGSGRHDVLTVVPADLLVVQLFFRSMGFNALRPRESDLIEFIWLYPPSRMETEAFHAIIKNAY